MLAYGDGDRFPEHVLLKFYFGIKELASILEVCRDIDLVAFAVKYIILRVSQHYFYNRFFVDL